MSPEIAKQLEKGMRAQEVCILREMLATTGKLERHLEQLLKSGMPVPQAVAAMLSSAFLSGVKFGGVHGVEISNKHPEVPLGVYAMMTVESVDTVAERIGRDDKAMLNAEATNPERN